MSFKDQLRDWLTGLWSDFWNVPYRSVLGLGAVVVLTVVLALWRTQAALDASVRESYRVASPFLLLLIFVLLAVAIPRRIR